MIRVATRRSRLARTQAGQVADLLRARRPGIEVVLHEVVTKGDRVADVPLARVGGKGLFVKEIEEALLAGEADVAVHSLKDLPALIAEGLTIGAVPAREDARDALCARGARRLADLPRGARVGTSSLRRVAQLRALRPDLALEPLRGNVETRLGKLGQGLDAVPVAHAGLLRLGLAQSATQIFAPEEMMPAVGQGALAVEARQDDGELLALLASFDHPETRHCTDAERALLRRLEGGCQTPIAAHATVEGNGLRLRALVASLDGSRVVRGERSGSRTDAHLLGEALADELLGKGAHEILKECERFFRDGAEV
jgi:hydroxymethylbilane synthase